MFEENSRYYPLETAEYITIDGQSIAYKRRRFLPPRDRLPLLMEVTVLRDDRLDLITAKTLGDPERFWVICDANNAMHPGELLSQPVQTLRIPIPQP
jgi:nucleoid-associated protein YgaU